MDPTPNRNTRNRRLLWGSRRRRRRRRKSSRSFCRAMRTWRIRRRLEFGRILISILSCCWTRSRRKKQFLCICCRRRTRLILMTCKWLLMRRLGISLSTTLCQGRVLLFMSKMTFLLSLSPSVSGWSNVTHTTTSKNCHSSSNSRSGSSWDNGRKWSKARTEPPPKTTSTKNSSFWKSTSVNTCSNTESTWLRCRTTSSSLISARPVKLRH